MSKTARALVGISATVLVLAVVGMGLFIWYLATVAPALAEADQAGGGGAAGKSQQRQQKQGAGGAKDEAGRAAAAGSTVRGGLPIIPSVGEALADKTVAALDPDTLQPFAVYFSPDGAAPRSVAGKLYDGVWYARDDMLFSAWPDYQAHDVPSSRFHPENELFPFVRAGMVASKLVLVAPGTVGEVVPRIDPDTVQATWTVLDGDALGLGAALQTVRMQQQQHASGQPNAPQSGFPAPGVGQQQQQQPQQQRPKHHQQSQQSSSARAVGGVSPPQQFPGAALAGSISAGLPPSQTAVQQQQQQRQGGSGVTYKAFPTD